MESGWRESAGVSLLPEGGGICTGIFLRAGSGEKGFLHFRVVRFGDPHGHNPSWGLSWQKALKSAHYLITS